MEIQGDFPQPAHSQRCGRPALHGSVTVSPIELLKAGLPRILDRLHTAAERHQLIAEAAYSIAASRGFGPGHELSDWLAAEREVNRACGLIEPSPRWDLAT